MLFPLRSTLAKYLSSLGRHPSVALGWRNFSMAGADEDDSTDPVTLHCDIFNGDRSADENVSPLVISHGMLGSSTNWSSLGRQLARTTGRTVACADARNHGRSPHVTSMSYEAMARDLQELIHNRLNRDRAILIGHSMGGRTSALAALKWPELVEKLLVVDVSTLNNNIDENHATEWNMADIFHSMLAVQFPRNETLSECRRDADHQLSLRISDPSLRAWLLMNMYESQDGTIGWRCNLDNIYKAFRGHITRFPEHHGLTYSGPTLFVCGSDSKYVPVADHAPIRESGLPNAEFVYVSGAGHWVHSQKPKEFMEEVLRFLPE